MRESTPQARLGRSKVNDSTPESPELVPVGTEGGEQMNRQTALEPRSRSRRFGLGGQGTLSDSQVAILLVAVLLVAAVFRFVGLDWDHGQHLHPDERFLTMVESAISIPNGLGAYFDTAQSPLNPYNNGFDSYVYGTLPLFVVRAVGELMQRADYGQIHLVGRVLSALADLSTIVLAFLIARRLYGRRVALLTASLLAVSVLSIQQAHFFTVDSFSAFFVALAFYFAVRVAQGGGRFSLLMLGVTFGAALASKVNIFLFGGVIVLAILIRLFQPSARGSTGVSTTTLSFDSGRAARLALAVALVVIVAFLSFRVFQPYAFAGSSFFDFRLNPQWLKDMDWIAKITSGELDYPPNHQWAARTPYVYPLQNMILWGMGPFLGVVSWLGLALGLFELLWRRRWQHLLPVAWVVLLFGYQGMQFVKYMRYYLPLYPFLVMLAAYLLVRWWDKGRDYAIVRRWPTWVAKCARPAAGIALAVVVVASLAWACAFTSLYTRPLSRVVASEWIYDHVAAGSALASELWDDALPLSLDAGRTSDRYASIELPLYDDDNADKVDRLVTLFDKADYIILSSDRLIGSISRLPMRYPMTIEYYRLLLSGDLGFEQVATFTSYPSLAGWEINDGSAEEAFTVYEHPRVRIFKKTAVYSHENAHNLLGRVPLDDVVRLRPAEVAQWKNGAQMTANERAIQMVGGTWSDIFQRDGLANQMPVLIWYLVAQVLGLLAFPLAFALFRNLRDRGYVVSKVLGVLLVVYLTWLAASLKVLPFAHATILLSVLVVAIAAGALLLRQRSAIVGFFSANRRLILVNEALFAGFFILFTLIRFGNPDLWHPAMGGEKPMDFAYLNAIVKSTYFPPYDPWFAGGYINYYYFGHLIVATLIKLTGIVPWVAYNVAIPWLFALTAMGAFCVAFNLVAAQVSGVGCRVSGEDPCEPSPVTQHFAMSASLRGPLLGGLLGAVFVTVAGNLGEVRLVIPSFQRVSGLEVQSVVPGLAGLIQTGAGMWHVLFGGQQLPVPINAWYWAATRVMPNGEINEFPFFTFLYADLHAHLIAMPFALMTLVAILNLAFRSGDVPGAVLAFGRRLKYDWLWMIGCLLVLALVLGELRANNTWDFPTYGLLMFAGLLIAEWHRRRRVEVGVVVVPLVAAVAVIVLSMLFYWPFLDRFSSGYSSVELWSGARTSLDDYVYIHGFLLFLIVTFLGIVVFGRDSRFGLARLVRLLVRRIGAMSHALDLLKAVSRPGSHLGLLLVMAWTVAVLMTFLAGLGLGLDAFLLPFIVVVAALLLRPWASSAERFVLLLVEAGFCLTAALDVIVLKGDIGRMNTVFKFYLQAWMLWGVAAAAAFAVIVPRLREWRPRWRFLWSAIFVLLLVAVLFYPLMASLAKIQDRFTPGSDPGLDGMAYMRQAVQVEQDQPIKLVDDYEALNWLLDNVKGSPVVLESAGVPLYRWNSRVSIYTGLPTVIGWDWHEKQQRSMLPWDVVEGRVADVQTIYMDDDWTRAGPLLQKYNVVYIYVGDLERINYPGSGLDKFEDAVGTLLDKVYQNRSVAIYRLRGV